MQASHIGFILPILIISIIGADAYPMYFHNRGYANSCTDAPSGPVGGHSTPVQDPSITFEVTQDGQAGPVTSLCPGQTYQVAVEFGGSSRAALLTVSSGSLAESNVPSCPNAMTTTGIFRQTSLKANWVLPCTVAGPLVIQMTSGVRSSGALLQNSASYPIDAVCEPTVACQPAAAAATTSTTTTSSSSSPAAAAAAPTPAAVPTPAPTQDATPATVPQADTPTPAAAPQTDSTTTPAAAPAADATTPSADNSSPTPPEASTIATQPAVMATVAATGGSPKGQDSSGSAGSAGSTSAPQWGMIADFFSRLLARVLECAGGC